MKIMISQPMAGIPDEKIRKQRDEIIEKFKKLHIEVVDSFITEEAPSDSYKPNVYYLGRTIMTFLHQVDAVYFADGWREARGCRIEHQICKEYGIKCLYSDFFETDTMKECVSAPTTSITIGNSHILGNGLRGSNSDITY